MERRGERVAGSRFLRDFCAGCGEPIRAGTVFSKVGPIFNYCEVCKPPHYKYALIDPAWRTDADPWQANMIRVMEEGER